MTKLHNKFMEHIVNKISIVVKMPNKDILDIVNILL